jgi:hypothetical protein
MPDSYFRPLCTERLKSNKPGDSNDSNKKRSKCDYIHDNKHHKVTVKDMYGGKTADSRLICAPLPYLSSATSHQNPFIRPALQKTDESHSPPLPTTSCLE